MTALPNAFNPKSTTDLMAALQQSLPELALRQRKHCENVGGCTRDTCKRRVGEALQTPETLRAHGVNDRELIEQTIRSVYDLRAKGDYLGVLKWVAEDVRCVMQGTWSLQTIPSPTVGKAAVAQAMRAITIDLEYIDYEIHELLIDGDRAAVHRTVTARNRGAGHPVTGGLWSYFRFRDGLIVEYAEYADSLGLAQLMGHVT